MRSANDQTSCIRPLGKKFHGKCSAFGFLNTTTFKTQILTTSERRLNFSLVLGTTSCVMRNQNFSKVAEFYKNEQIVEMRKNSFFVRLMHKKNSFQLAW